MSEKLNRDSDQPPIEIPVEPELLVDQFYGLRLERYRCSRKLRVLWQYDRQNLRKNLKSLHLEEEETKWSSELVERKLADFQTADEAGNLSLEDERLRLVLELLPYREDRLKIEQGLTELEARLQLVERRMALQDIDVEQFTDRPQSLHWRLSQIENRLGEILLLTSDGLEPWVNYADEYKTLYDEYCDLIKQLGNGTSFPEADDDF